MTERTTLPTETVTAATRRSIFLTLFGTIALVGLFNLAAKFYLIRHTPNRSDWLIREKWELLLRLEKPVDWLILGDSSCNQGIDPSLFDSDLKTTSINLCTVGNMTNVNNAWMLEAYIQRFGPPRHILIVHVYDVWGRDIDPMMMARVPLQLQRLSQFEPRINQRRVTNFQVLLERYLPLYSKNQSLQEVMMFPLDSYETNRSFSLKEDGLMVWHQPNPENVEGQKTMHLSNIQQKPTFQLSNTNRQALEHIISLAEKHQFDVYLANSPIYNELYQQKEFQGYYNQVRDMLRHYANSSSRVHYVLQEPVTFPKEEMENADHVIYPAAKQYTQQLVQAISAEKKQKDIQAKR
ncbi:hypothetical protein NIES2135_09100 [Leptolyngbya boryana NIES-2135]|jgi:hypothetical protein|uniref:Uncharacterized protein n=1 Tax=Leptolyngbya boryana NIES-2135 TaxID=1973484 RepID=A0A1Z4JBH6_LEPBY|nr:MULTISPECIES: hypothetical protein [Leptolyngbya]BAY54096.1 hypothetical protein NIES2135_09100 [Leptolyngbya boryana NIES-2135]MBD2369752.1 hypothetical protein [Leptolyngbya sp. FACHB-161]MBD2376047.1 hypothetical protein [Leptolyngbya sp. FACHB-238]MBD2400323.1 hypothetical protein [Leptolyngbya sp. FACHB-239]MBD2406864.1 hypothetical protein [Leptolyngbya sp. FACHB-402]